MSEPPEQDPHGQYPSQGDPQYPSYPAQPPFAYGQAQGYPQPGYTPEPQPQPQPLNITALLGPRAWRRADVRIGSALAGAGAALLLGGLLVGSVGYFVHGFGISYDDDSFRPSTHGEARRFLGFVLFLGISAIGYLLLVVRRSGPLTTAATVVTAFGVPLALEFGFLQIDDLFRGGLPINIDAVFLISIAAWLISYLAVPGARGRTVYLALAAAGLPGYISFKVAGGSAVRAGADVFGSGDAGGSHLGTVAALGLVFGLVYYAAAWLLDRSSRHGVATALVYAGFGTTVLGLAASAQPIGQVGVGVLVAVVSLALACYGALFGRRFTAWVWSAGIVVGLAVVVSKIDTNKYWVIAVLLGVLGVAVIAVAQGLSSVLREQPDLPEFGSAPAP